MASQIDQEKLAYAKAMGIEVWQRPDRQKEAQTPIIEATKPNPDTSTTWEALRKQALACTACALHKTRQNVVFGTGNQQAEVMVIGEAPGQHEDLQGEPFVGRAGQLLNNMVKAIGLDRESIYIANILKCRPPRNRDPELAEVQTCTPLLKQQIQLIQPKVILAVGRIAAHFLLNTDKTLGALRQQRHHYGDSHIPLYITYHPAYLLRNPIAKRKTLQDLQLLHQAIQ